MKKFIAYLKQAFDAKDTTSSKRIFGALGFVLASLILIGCTIARIQAPDMVESYMIASVCLLGVDSITNIWRKNDEQQG